MNNLIGVGKILISDVEFFVEQLQLLLNNPYILKIVGDEEIKIDKPPQMDIPEFSLKIFGRIRGEIGEISAKLMESEFIPREKIYLKGVIIEKNITLSPQALLNPQMQPTTPTIKIPLVQKTKVYLVELKLLKILPLELIEIVRRFLERFREIPRPIK